MNLDKFVVDFLVQSETSFSCEFIGHGPFFPQDTDTRDIYQVTLSNRRHTFKFNFGQSVRSSASGRKIADAGDRPTAYDVIAAMAKHHPGSIQEFCEEFGYDPGSEEVECIYIMYGREWEAVRQLFTEEELEIYKEIN